MTPDCTTDSPRHPTRPPLEGGEGVVRRVWRRSSRAPRRPAGSLGESRNPLAEILSGRELATVTARRAEQPHRCSTAPVRTAGIPMWIAQTHADAAVTRPRHASSAATPSPGTARRGRSPAPTSKGTIAHEFGERGVTSSTPKDEHPAFLKTAPVTRSEHSLGRASALPGSRSARGPLPRAERCPGSPDDQTHAERHRRASKHDRR